MQNKFLTSNELYDGSQLVSLRSYLKHGLLGDSIVAWIGPCKVTLDHMVDGEDLVAGAEIRGSMMVHFIVEKFDCSLLAAVGLQRLLASIVKDQLVTICSAAGGSATSSLARGLYRDGDDIFSEDGRKLSISIATVSPANALIHLAVNVSNEGTPVKTLSLENLGVQPRAFAEAVMEKFCRETMSMVEATKKVRWVK